MRPTIFSQIALAYDYFCVEKAWWDGATALFSAWGEDAGAIARALVVRIDTWCARSWAALQHEIADETTACDALVKAILEDVRDELAAPFWHLAPRSENMHRALDALENATGRAGRLPLLMAPLPRDPHGSVPTGETSKPVAETGQLGADDVEQKLRDLANALSLRVFGGTPGSHYKRPRAPVSAFFAGGSWKTSLVGDIAPSDLGEPPVVCGDLPKDGLVRLCEWLLGALRERQARDSFVGTSADIALGQIKGDRDAAVSR